MPRIQDTARKDALKAKTLLSANLVKISFGCSVDTYADQASCETGGETWTDDILISTFSTDLTADVGGGPVLFAAATDLLSVSDIEESLSMDLGTVSLSLSGVSGQWMQISQQVELINRTVEIWKVLLDPATMQIINAPFKLFGGVVVAGGIKKSHEGDGSVVSIEVSNEFYNFEVYGGFRCTVNDHQNFFPGDTGFKFCTSIKKKLVWGTE